MPTPPASPTAPAPTPPLHLQTLAEQIARHLSLRSWLQLQTRAALPVTLGILVFTPLAWLLQWHALPTLLLIATALWLVLSALWTWNHRPTPYTALAHWGQTAGHGESLAAAWSLAKKTNPTPADQHHLHHTQQLLHSTPPSLNQTLPLPLHPHLIPPALGLLLSLIWSATWQPPAAPPDPPLSPAMRAQAAQQATQLRQQLDATTPPNLSPSDQQNLQDQLSAATDLLQNSDSNSLRDLLTNMERHARELEKLAQTTATNDDWASPALRSTLQNQADTADLGSATAARAPLPGAEAAERIANLLDSATRGSNLLTRLESVFETLRSSATQDDPDRLVGGPVLQANSHLRSLHPAEAAATMRTLARRLREEAQNQQTRQQLDNLVQQLRQAAASVASADSTSDPTTADQPTPTSESPTQDSTQDSNQSTTLLSQSPSATSPSPASDTPGSQAREQSASGGNSAQNPQTTDGSPSTTPGTAQIASPQPSDTQPADPDAPRLLAPIPGSPNPDTPTPSLLAITDSNQDSSKSPGGSGKNAGQGSAPLNTEPTDTATRDITRQAIVQALRGNTGDSSFRQVQGQDPASNTPQSTTTAPDISQTFLQAEEQAITDSALPMDRRNHIKRYFQALRQAAETSTNTP